MALLECAFVESICAMMSLVYASLGVAISLTLTPASAREATLRDASSPELVPLPLAGASATRQARLGADSADFRAELALRYAPIHHQGVNQHGKHALSGAADYITSYDFDHDDDARNNWDNAGDPRFPPAASAYFSVVETGSHWFLTYLFFHARDWSSSFFETEHENDAEGLLLAVARDGSRYGALRAAVTVAHSNFFSYVPAGSPWRSGAENVDGKLSLLEFEGALHPITAQEAEGHALKAWPYFSIHGDGVIYYPSLSEAQVPKSPNDTHVLYRLRDVLEPGGMWERRHDPRLFGEYGAFAGNKSGGCGDGVFLCLRNAAHAPWAWDDHNDASPKGAMASDPAALAKSYFETHETLALTYRFNPFR
jgi:hypothetical protein